MEFLNIVLEVNQAATSLNQHLNGLMPDVEEGDDACGWWWCNVACSEDVSTEVARYIGNHNIDTCPVLLLDHNPAKFCEMLCT